MSSQQSGFQEHNPYSRPIQDLRLRIAGSRLEPIIEEFKAELERAGVRRVRPHFYLSTEWGVVTGTVAIAIPFYLARPDLIALQAERIGHIEGFNRIDILRYLRHEMGHVVNYAYRLYEEEDWVKHFGSITQPYLEEYRPEPFSRRYVRHLPGWYAQKHPDEDWAETFAIWMTPQLDWRAEYGDWPEALAKLEYCNRTMQALAEREPMVTADELDEDVSQLSYSVEDYYHRNPAAEEPFPHGLDGALRAIFEDLDVPEEAPADIPRKPASMLIRQFERDLIANVYRWTGHFPEYTRALLRHLEARAEALQQVYPESLEASALLALTTLVTALAVNHVHRGTYLP
jgi:Putative zinc-binding metallo-peptidase